MWLSTGTSPAIWDCRELSQSRSIGNMTSSKAGSLQTVPKLSVMPGLHRENWHWRHARSMICNKSAGIRYPMQSLLLESRIGAPFLAVHASERLSTDSYDGDFCGTSARSIHGDAWKRAVPAESRALSSNASEDQETKLAAARPENLATHNRPAVASYACFDMSWNCPSTC